MCLEQNTSISRWKYVITSYSIHYTKLYENLDYIRVPLGRYYSKRLRVEGDWSSAAFLLAAGVVSGKVHVDNLDISSSQADKEIRNNFV